MRYYTIDDIKELLEQEVYGLQWNKEIRDGLTVRKATPKDLDNSVIKLKTDHKVYGECFIPISVSNLNLLIYDTFGIGKYLGQFEEEWIDLLLKNHKEEYAKFLAEYTNSQKVQIREEADKDIENFTKNTNEKVENKFKTLDKYMKKASIYLENNSAELGEE